MIGKFIYDENKQRINIEDALTITKGRWADGNELNEDRIGYFVTSDNENNEIEIATAASYICGVTIKDDTFLHPNLDDASYCVVQSLGLCQVRDDGTLSPGDKCMPSDEGIAVRSSNNLGYRVVSRVDDNLVKIIVAPNNDMIQRIKEDKAGKSKLIETTLLASNWNDDDEYILNVEGVTTTSNQEILPSLDITEVQLDALQSAKIQDGGQNENTIILKAFGNTPIVDIPIRVILRGDA